MPSPQETRDRFQNEAQFWRMKRNFRRQFEEYTPGLSRSKGPRQESMTNVGNNYRHSLEPEKYKNVWHRQYEAGEQGRGMKSLQE